MAVYTAWPVAADVDALLESIGVTRTDARQADQGITARLIAAVTAKVVHDTHRQFIPATATRYFDGSGTGEQQVDEIVTLTSVALMGADGTVSLTLSNVLLRADNTFPNTIIEIRQGTPFGGGPYLDRFPAGRQNIRVIGSWGYGATIPADLWEAVAGEVAARRASQLLFEGAGRLKSWKEADVSEDYLVQLPGEAAGWHDAFVAAVKAYTRQRSPARIRPAMI